MKEKGAGAKKKITRGKNPCTILVRRGNFNKDGSIILKWFLNK
jgi:hypothetical protein